MKVAFKTEVRDEKTKDYKKIEGVGKVVHFYENNTCLIQPNNDKVLYRVEMRHVEPLEK